MLHQQIAKADYHGCLLMITRSKCPSHIGIKGIVVLETKNTFQIICEDDKLRSKSIHLNEHEHISINFFF